MIGTKQVFLVLLSTCLVFGVPDTRGRKITGNADMDSSGTIDINFNGLFASQASFTCGSGGSDYLDESTKTKICDVAENKFDECGYSAEGTDGGLITFEFKYHKDDADETLKSLTTECAGAHKPPSGNPNEPSPDSESPPEAEG